MQQVDLNSLPNSSGWQVVHDADDQLFRIENARGRKLPGKFTGRLMAEKKLYDYLQEMAEKNIETAQKPRGRKKNVDASTEATA